MSDQLTHLSLFSGIGGLDLAAEMAGFKTVGQCEWADYPTKVLEKHWPDVPRWRDIRTLTGESFHERTGLRTVDVISGGFPCQPFSVAGQRRGKEDDRYLWPEMLRVIQEIRPTWVVGENVAGIVNLALDTVLSDLENVGYTCQTLIIPACAVDAAHRRDRVAIISYNNEIRCGVRGSERKRIQRDIAFDEIDSSGKIVADSNSPRREKFDVTSISEKKRRFTRRITQKRNVSDSNNRSWIMRWNRELSAVDEIERDWSDNRGGTEEHVSGKRRTTQPGMGGVVDGVPAWMDRYWVEEPDIPRITTNKKNRANRLKCLGNAVYWRQFYPIFGAIAEMEENYGN